MGLSIEQNHICPDCKRACELGWTTRMRRAWFCTTIWCKWLDTALYPADRAQRKRTLPPLDVEAKTA